MKLKYRGIALIMALLLFFQATPTLASEDTKVESLIANYMGARQVAMLVGASDMLEECAVIGIVADEELHYETYVDEGIRVVGSSYEILSIEESDIEVVVFLEEKVGYIKEWKLDSETVQHEVRLMYGEDNKATVVSDSYYEECSAFVSASYVNPYAMVLADEGGAASCIIHIAETQVGYCEKKSNANLDSFTANAGSGNYTKYGEWYGLNPSVWCAMFVAWCADQANVSTAIIPKTADCDISRKFFISAGQFHKSKAYGGNYTPQVGDIFFSGDSEIDASHIGIVVAVGSSSFTAVHGNSSDNNVKKSTYSVKNTSLLGFGTPAYENDTHNYVYSSTSASHTGTCSVCNHTTASASHMIDYDYHANSHWGNCSVCGYFVSPTSHTHSLLSNSTGHWSECSVCGFNYGTTVTAHTYEWEYDDINHWKECTVCGYTISKAAHTWQNMGAYTKCIYCGKTQ